MRCMRLVCRAFFSRRAVSATFLLYPHCDSGLAIADKNVLNVFAHRGNPPEISKRSFQRSLQQTHGVHTRVTKNKQAKQEPTRRRPNTDEHTGSRTPRTVRANSRRVGRTSNSADQLPTPPNGSIGRNASGRRRASNADELSAKRRVSRRGTATDLPENVSNRAGSRVRRENSSGLSMRGSVGKKVPNDMVGLEAEYHPSLSRVDAVKMLNGKRAYTFVIRNSSQSCYCLSFVTKDGKALEHTLITQDESGGYRIGIYKKGFQTIPELLRYYGFTLTSDKQTKKTNTALGTSTVQYEELPPTSTSLTGIPGLTPLEQKKESVNYTKLPEQLQDGTVKRGPGGQVLAENFRGLGVDQSGRYEGVRFDRTKDTGEN